MLWRREVRVMADASSLEKALRIGPDLAVEVRKLFAAHGRPLRFPRTTLRVTPCEPVRTTCGPGSVLSPSPTRRTPRRLQNFEPLLDAELRHQDRRRVALTAMRER
jgi:hypothetical protein